MTLVAMIEDSRRQEFKHKESRVKNQNFEYRTGYSQY
jgi:hypothetical protein